MPRRYAFLHFAPGVDWQHVDPTLLVRVNRLGMVLGKVITIISGARTRQNNTGVPGSHHIPANNPSGMGEAVDAEIGGKPLALVVKEATLKRYGLYSGNRPGFYRGKPDPAHIETIERRTGQQTAVVSAAQTASTPAVGAPVDTSQPPIETAMAGGPPPPEASLPSISAPGSVPAQEDVSFQNPAETWRQIASQPLASQDAQLFASRLTGG